MSYLFLTVTCLVSQQQLGNGRKGAIGKLLHRLLNVTLPLATRQCLSANLHAIRGVLIPTQLALFANSTTLSLRRFNTMGKVTLPLIFFPTTFLVALSKLLVPRLSSTRTLKRHHRITHLIRNTLRVALPTKLLVNYLFAILKTPLKRQLCRGDFIKLLLRVLKPLTPIVCLSDITAKVLGKLNRRIRSL